MVTPVIARPNSHRCAWVVRAGGSPKTVAPIIVPARRENRPGATGNISAQFMIDAPADGEGTLAVLEIPVIAEPIN